MVYKITDFQPNMPCFKQFYQIDSVIPVVCSLISDCSVILQLFCYLCSFVIALNVMVSGICYILK